VRRRVVREPEGPPEELLTFRREDWSSAPLPTEVDALLLRLSGRVVSPDEWRVRRWAEARRRWHERHGWPGGLVALVLDVAEVRRRWCGRP
jgi:hypothetical protein